MRGELTIVSGLAARAHGVVTRRRLLAAGLSPKQIDRLVAAGVLIVVHRGVYRVGHVAPSTDATYMAAVAACGRGALLGGAASAHQFRLTSGRPPRPEVWTPARHRVPGVGTRRIDAGCGTLWRGIPTITVPQTLVAPGAAKLREALGGAPIGELELRFRRVLRAAGLPRPDRVNRREGSFYLDCRWRRPGLTVELDSFRFHNTRHAWERDRRREREAYARGDRFRRYTWHDVAEAPQQMLAELSAILG